MKKALILVLLVMTLSLAQEVRQLAVLPFEASGGAAPYTAGMAAGLQRSLNVIDNVFVPPVGDVLAVAERLQELERLSPEALAEAFGADVIITGFIEATGPRAQVLIGLSGPAFAEAQDLVVSGPVNDPPSLIEGVVNEVIAALALRLSGEDRQEVNGILAQTPSLPSLGAVAGSSLRTHVADLAQLEAARELDGDSSWVLAEFARGAALAGDFERAGTLAAEAVSLAPQDVEAWSTYGIILLSAGNAEAALSAFEEVLALNPAHALALAGKGRLLIGTDDAEAESLLRRAIEIYPRLVDAYLDLARLQENSQQAVRILRGGTAKVPESAALHDAVILEALRLGDEAGALNYLRQILAEHPESPPGVYALASRVPGEGALALVRQGRERYPESAILATSESSLLEHQGDFEGAEAALEGLTPDNLEAINRLAIVQARQGKLEEAQATLEAVAEADINLQVNLAQIYIQAGQSRAAVELLERLIEEAPQDAEIWTLYGIALGRAGRYNQALTALEEALALDPESDQARRALSIIEQSRGITEGQEIELTAEAGTAFEAGLAALEAGNLSQAAGEFDRALALEDSGLIAFYQGYALQLSGNARQAVNSYRRALEDFPRNSTINNNLGYAYLQIGRYDRALHYIGEAINLDETNATAHLNLGLTYYSLRRYGEAVEAWERAIALNPELEGELVSLLEDARNKANP